MSITKVSNYVIEDGAITLEKLNVPGSSAGQVLTVDGSGNLLFTDKLVSEDVEDIVAGLIAAGTHTNITITYNDAAGSLSFNATGAVSSVNGLTGAVTLTTSNITEGTRLYFTNARARSAISITDSGGDGSLSYNSTTGVLTYTGPSASEVRAHFSAGTGIAISNGQISIGQPVGTTSNVTFHDIDATGNVVVEGNLTVQGTTTTINAANLSVSDNMIYLNNAGEATITNAVGNGTTVTYTADNYFSAGYTVDVTGVNPTSFNVSGATIVSADSTSFTINSTVTDTYVSGGEARAHTNTNVDLGWAGSYNDGSYAHAGMFRDATDGVFKIFDSYIPEPDETATIDTGHASYNAASFRVNNLTAEGYVDATYFVGDGANLTSVLTNYSTTDLIEGTNLYYTSARVESDIQTYLTTSTNQDAIVAGSLTLGNGVTLSESVDRVDLLSIVSNTAGQGGLQIANNNGEGLWSFMTDATKLYIYDDKYEKIHAEFTENNGVVFRHNGSAKLSTKTFGAQVEGDMWLNSASFTNLNHAVTRGWVENRIAADLSVLTTDDITEGANLYWTTARGDANFATNLATSTTDNLAEGTANLYYTDARVDARLATLIVINDTSEFGELIYNTQTGQIDHWGVTTAEIRGTLSPGTGVSYSASTGVISIGQPVSTVSNVTFNDITATGNVGIQGNLTVSGTVTFVNTEELQIADNIITLNSDLPINTPPSENAGIEVNRGNQNDVAIRWNEAVDAWQFTNNGVTYQNIGSLSASSTDDLAEGSTNLYFTNERVDDRVSTLLQPGTNITLTYNDVANTLIIGSDSTGGYDLSNNTTDDLFEGTTNLYYTVARSRSSISATDDIVYDSNTGVISFSLGNHSTSELPEGTNLYYTNARADARVNLLRTDLENPGLQDVHFGNLTNVPTVTNQIITGTGSTTYTLNYNPGSAAGILVTIQGVMQEPITDYTVSGTSITFNPALPSGQKALVRYVGYQISGGTVTTATNADQLDGLDSSQFLRSDASDTMVGNLTMTGNIVPSANVTYNLGSSTNRWNELWLSTTTVNLGDNALSADISNKPKWNSSYIILSDLSSNIVPVTDNVYNLGSSTKQFATIYGHEIEATYADLAERYASDAPYEPGTVVVFGGEAEITTTTIDLDVAVAGVISTNPALKLNSQAGNSQTHPYVALRGRVPCKVVGPVRKGDLLVTSNVAGYAMSVGKKDMGRSVFAKSIAEDLSDGTKTIEVVII